MLAFYSAKYDQIGIHREAEEGLVEKEGLYPQFNVCRQQWVSRHGQESKAVNSVLETAD